MNSPWIESDTQWLRAQPSSWAKSGSLGPLPISGGSGHDRDNESSVSIHRSTWYRWVLHVQEVEWTSLWRLSGHVQDWEHMQHPGTCGALMYLWGVTQGEWVPAECLSRSVIIMCKSKYIHRGLYLSRSEKKAAFSSYSSPALYNRWVTWRKELNKKAVTHYW